MSAKFSDRHLVLSYSTDSVDFMDGTKDGDILNMKYWDEAYFIINKTTGATGTAEFRVHASTDITSTSTTGIGTIYYRSCKTSDTNSVMSAWASATSSGFVMSAGAFECWEIMVRSQDLPADHSYIWLNSTEISNNPCGGAVTALLAGPSYGRDISDNVLI